MNNTMIWIKLIDKLKLLSTGIYKEELKFRLLDRLIADFVAAEDEKDFRLGLKKVNGFLDFIDLYGGSYREYAVTRIFRLLHPAIENPITQVFTWEQLAEEYLKEDGA